MNAGPEQEYLKNWEKDRMRFLVCDNKIGIFKSEKGKGNTKQNSNNKNNNKQVSRQKR